MLPNNILIFGGTGALGTVLCKRILSQFDNHSSSLLTVFSRDEAKHFKLQNELPDLRHMLSHFVGDIRDPNAVEKAIRLAKPQLIINCAALKQVPLCEEFIEEAVKTNVHGTLNITRALQKENRDTILLTISTDKACKPINAYGFTKALQEKITLSECNHSCVVRYGNVLESTGSVIPFFKSLLAQNKKLPVTSKQMTRFLLSLDEAVDLIFSAINQYGLTFYNSILVPTLRSARIMQLAEILCEQYGKDPEHWIYESGIRPGEKMHEILISEHEALKVFRHQNYYVIGNRTQNNRLSEAQFCSSSPDVLIENKAQLRRFLNDKGVISCSQSQSQVLQAS